jgi:hypothetical protein
VHCALSARNLPCLVITADLRSPASRTAKPSLR